LYTEIVRGLTPFKAAAHMLYKAQKILHKQDFII
jgi:hypothetical protein